MAAAALAMVVANTPLGPSYRDLMHFPLGPMSVEHWVNDGLMALFFLLVGLEIKREVVDGELSTWPNRALPGLAAVGGMVVPGLIFVALNLSSPETLRGWAIPAATDIAFALGVLSLLGKRVPVSLKIFLTALAVLDDLGAIVIIALFYTAGLDLLALSGAGLTLFIMIVLNRLHVMRLWPYLVLSAALWWFMYKSGVHATLAGVAAALTIPLKRTPAQPDAVDSPLHILEHAIQPWVAFLVLPIFGFANAGVPLTGMDPRAVFSSAPLGVAAGLFFGKQVGVLGACYLAVKLKWAERPTGASWLQVYGVALLCGIGFTMSLFIALLAFPNHPQLIDAVKLGVLGGSLLSAIAGAAVLLACKPKEAARSGPP
jgi:NhaA family Na+:H+ antiporter